MFYSYIPRLMSPNSPNEVFHFARIAKSYMCRRERNRLSQRSFRERRLAYVNDLEEATKRAAQTESERNKMLINENTELRNAYLKLRRKLLGVLCTIQEVSNEAYSWPWCNPSTTRREVWNNSFEYFRVFLTASPSYALYRCRRAALHLQCPCTRPQLDGSVNLLLFDDILGKLRGRF